MNKNKDYYKALAEVKEVLLGKGGLTQDQWSYVESALGLMYKIGGVEGLKSKVL